MLRFNFVTLFKSVLFKCKTYYFIKMRDYLTFYLWLTFYFSNVYVFSLYTKLTFS